VIEIASSSVAVKEPHPSDFEFESYFDTDEAKNQVSSSAPGFRHQLHDVPAKIASVDRRWIFP